MNTEQAINYEKAVVNSALEWVSGNSEINGIIELLLIASAYKINLPKCSYHFQYSENPNHLCATGGHKTLFKTLDKLKAAIQSKPIKLEF